MSGDNYVETILNSLQPPFVETLDETPLLVLPPGWNQKSMEQYLPQPVKLMAHPTFSKTESLFDYVKDFSAANTTQLRIFADDEKFRISVVLDPHQDGRPSHQNHTATLAFHRAPEWDAWREISGMWLSPTPFRRFLENHLEYITGEEFNGTKVLEMCRSLSVKYKGETHIKTDGTGANRSLEISEETEGGGKVSPDLYSTVPFPEFLEIELRIFRNCEVFQFKPRLRVHVEGQHDVQFCIDLMEPSIVEERAFAREIELVTEHFKWIPVLYGSM